MTLLQYDPVAFLANTINVAVHQPKHFMDKLCAPKDAYGVYLMHYTGDCEIHRGLIDEGDPIYIGQGKVRNRLRSHVKSLNDVWDLELVDFQVQMLLLPDKGWAAKVEHDLHIYFDYPLWNTAPFKGFGTGTSQRPAKKATPWDVLYPGRPRADGLIRPPKEQQAYLIEKARRLTLARKMDFRFTDQFR